MSRYRFVRLYTFRDSQPAGSAVHSCNHRACCQAWPKPPQCWDNIRINLYHEVPWSTICHIQWLNDWLNSNKVYIDSSAKTTAQDFWQTAQEAPFLMNLLCGFHLPSAVSLAFRGRSTTFCLAVYIETTTNKWIMGHAQHGDIPGLLLNGFCDLLMIELACREEICHTLIKKQWWSWR